MQQRLVDAMLYSLAILSCLLGIQADLAKPVSVDRPFIEAFEKALAAQRCGEALALAQRTADPLARQPLAAGDGPARLRLARLALRWTDNADLARRLGRDAVQLASNPTTVAQWLKDEN